MTEVQKELVNKLFNDYCFGHSMGRDGIKEFHIRDFFYSPDKLDTTKRVAENDKRAAETIKECEKAIETLKAYRVALAERYAELETAPTIPVVKLEREKRWKGTVTYHLRVCKRYISENKDIEVEHIAFTGTERHKAIKAYKEYVKAHPGITAEMDIEKRRWE